MVFGNNLQITDQLRGAEPVLIS